MRPSVKAAEWACRAMAARQVVVIAIDADGRYAVVSYGETKAECAAVKPLCNAVADALGAGVLPGPYRAPSNEKT